MGSYVIRSDHPHDPALCGYLHGITLRPSYIDVDIRGPMADMMEFETYAEACSVIAFIAACIDFSYGDSLQVVPARTANAAFCRKESSENGV